MKAKNKEESIGRFLFGMILLLFVVVYFVLCLEFIRFLLAYYHDSYVFNFDFLKVVRFSLSGFIPLS